MAGVAYSQILTGVSHLQSLFFSVDDDPTTEISMLKETPRMRTVQMNWGMARAVGQKVAL